MAMEPTILKIGKICPNCGSTRFSVTPPPEHLELPNGVLGIGDCQSCQKENILVRLAPELNNAISALFSDCSIKVQKIVYSKLFPDLE
ncbi:hypothetical protein D4R87_00170 [bacterium]|nr:MAG: hypothetical protein D4R87_00170 [bacterium]